MIIKMKEHCGVFAENKDIAREIREKIIKPNFSNKDDSIILDFTGVDSSTQSFIHALISFFFQSYGEAALERLSFKNCNKILKSLITAVINYSLG